MDRQYCCDVLHQSPKEHKNYKIKWWGGKISSDHGIWEDRDSMLAYACTWLAKSKTICFSASVTFMEDTAHTDYVIGIVDGPILANHTMVLSVIGVTVLTSSPCPIAIRLDLLFQWQGIMWHNRCHTFFLIISLHSWAYRKVHKDSDIHDCSYSIYTLVCKKIVHLVPD